MINFRLYILSNTYCRYPAHTQLMVDYTCTVILDIGQTPGVTLHTTDNLLCARHPIIISVLLYSHNVIASGKPRSFDASLIRFIDTKIHEWYTRGKKKKGSSEAVTNSPDHNRICTPSSTGAEYTPRFWSCLSSDSNSKVYYVDTYVCTYFFFVNFPVTEFWPIILLCMYMIAF